MPDDTPLDLARLLEDAVSEALSHEDAHRFLAWFRDHVTDYETASSPEGLLDPPFVALLGRSIWNALPLPGNGFRPRSLPEPGRNDPCFCGSGNKYKRCCATRPSLALDPGAILPQVLERMDTDDLASHLRAGRAPVDAVTGLAAQRLERGELWNALDLLEPLFEGDIRSAGEHAGHALDMLCDLYMTLGHNRRREALLDRLVRESGRSPLRSDAWQRIAVGRLDRGDRDGAWEAFHEARRDNPEAPGVGLLEIQLLMSDSRAGEARQRAAFWSRRLRKQNYRGDERLVRFFEQVSQDPHAVMADMGLKAAGGAGERFLAWMKEVSARPLPEYAVETVGEHDTGQPLTLCLIVPGTLRAIETDWHAVFPLDKPASTFEMPDSPDDPWDPYQEAGWTDFLMAHPESFDSLDIIDDLLTALTMHPQYSAGWLDHTLVDPLLARAEAIVDHALHDRSGFRLGWNLSGNRPALRCLARRAQLESRRGDDAAAAHAAGLLLALDPDDDQGVRDALAPEHREED